MSKTNTPDIPIYPFQATELDNSVDRYGEIPTVQTMRDVYLFGVPLKSSLTGQEVNDTMIQTFINAAIGQLEMDLNITITPTTFDERHDWIRQQWTHSFGWLKPNHRPIINVSEMSIVFSNDEQRSVTFPNEFIYVNSQDAAIQVVPAIGTSMQGFLVSVFAGSQMWALYSQNLGSFPGAIRVVYKAGFEKDKIPYMISSLIGLIASYKLLTNIGPLIFPFGSYSIGADGLSQSISSPGPQFLAQRINDLKDQIEQEMQIARHYFLASPQIDWL